MDNLWLVKVDWHLNTPFLSIERSNWTYTFSHQLILDNTCSLAVASENQNIFVSSEWHLGFCDTECIP